VRPLAAPGLSRSACGLLTGSPSPPLLPVTAGALTKIWTDKQVNKIRIKALAAVLVPPLLEGVALQMATLKDDAKRRYAGCFRLALKVEGALAAVLEGKPMWEKAKKEYLGSDEYKTLIAKAKADAAELQGATAVQAVAATAAAA